jgi:hypothetical protein
MGKKILAWVIVAAIFAVAYYLATHAGPVHH